MMQINKEEKIFSEREVAEINSMNIYWKEIDKRGDSRAVRLEKARVIEMYGDRICMLILYYLKKEKELMS